MNLGRLLGGAAALAVAWFAHGVYKMLSPSEYTSGPMIEECRRVFGESGVTVREPDDVDLAWQSDHWMDSTLRCRMRTTPERVALFTSAIMLSNGESRQGVRTTVRYTRAGCIGDQYACPRYGEIGARRLPDWWDVSVRDAEWFSMTQEGGSGSNVHGVNFAASESGGFVFAERWRT